MGKYYPDERERQLVSRLDYIARYSGEYKLGNVLVQHIKGGFYLRSTDPAVTTSESEESEEDHTMNDAVDQLCDRVNKYKN